MCIKREKSKELYSFVTLAPPWRECSKPCRATWGCTRVSDRQKEELRANILLWFPQKEMNKAGQQAGHWLMKVISGSGAQGLSLVAWYTTVRHLRKQYQGLKYEILVKVEDGILVGCAIRRPDQPLARTSKLGQDSYITPPNIQRIYLTMYYNFLFLKK